MPSEKKATLGRLAWGVLLGLSQQGALAAKTSCLQGYIACILSSRLNEVILRSVQHLWDHIWSAISSSGLAGKDWSEPTLGGVGPPNCQGTRARDIWRRDRGTWACSAWRRQRPGSYCCLQLPSRECWKNGPRLSLEEQELKGKRIQIATGKFWLYMRRN